MSRPFEFGEEERFHARLRQNGRCACCGENLDDLEENAHHVVPNQSGKQGNISHSWLSTVENCVVLCSACHYRVHEDGRYRVGAVAPPSYFPISHGGREALHKTWVAELEQRICAVWPQGLVK